MMFLYVSVCLQLQSFLSVFLSVVLCSLMSAFFVFDDSQLLDAFRAQVDFVISVCAVNGSGARVTPKQFPTLSDY